MWTLYQISFLFLLLVKISLCQEFEDTYTYNGPKLEVLFTKEELVKLRRTFSHIRKDKHLNLLNFARPWDTDYKTGDLLWEISKRCSMCQRFSSTAIHFNVSIPDGEELMFGEKLSMDPIFLESKVVLHIIDTATRLSAATFLDSSC